MWGLCAAVVLIQSLGAAPTVGVVADDLVDYSQWAAPQKAVWAGKEIVRLLADKGVTGELLTKDSLSLEGFSKYDAILIATDNSYPERGAWGGPVAKALKQYVEQGGIYIMPLGIPHYASYDLDTRKLDMGHFDDFFGLHGAITQGRGVFKLTKQGRDLGLPDPSKARAAAARTLSFSKAAALVWDASYVPVLSAAPIGRGWLVHWGGGAENGMDASVRDFLIPAFAETVKAIKAGHVRALGHSELFAEEGLKDKTLDDLDREVFQPGPAPLDSEATVVKLQASEKSVEPIIARDTLLDGEWRMLGFPKGRGDARALAFGQGWNDSVAAKVPCSVQTALFAAGKIPDPVVGLNDQIARTEVAEKEWWFRKDFDGTPGQPTRLVFDGVDYSATFFLNGERLGEHEGPFGGPSFDVTGLLRAHNTLVVRVDPLPPDWKLAFKTNCVYGWHYVNCPPIGIWHSVHLERVPKVEIDELFVAAKDVKKGTVDAHVSLRGPEAGITGTLEGRISPANFDGPTYRFSIAVNSAQPQHTAHLRFDVPDPKLWWPVDLGEPNLYKLDLTFVQDGAAADQRSRRFGIRTIEMKPLPDGPRPDRYKWTFVVNGRPSFLKGCNWATLDAFLRLDKSRYSRFLTMAKDEHIQIMRSWGGGLLETDTFYDLCDELGIMVMQEFPLTWQNFDVLRPAVSDEIATLNVKRLRNHPSLAMWCGGNEHSGEGALIELLGRRCLELDGTRPYHRTDPYGGSVHNYDVYWGKQPFEAIMKFVPLGNGPAVIGETGMASPCAVESTLRFLPESERGVWPPPEGGAFIHHTPTFTPVNMEYLNKHAMELDECKDLAGFTRGAQLAQALAQRLVLERMRANWPNATAMIFYKLTDVFPGCSWSTVDYFGVPKIAHYFTKQSYAPLHVCVFYESLDLELGKPFAPKIMVMDDLESLEGAAQASVRLLDAALQPVADAKLAPTLTKGRVHDLGNVSLTVPTGAKAPFILLAELRVNNELRDRTFHWFNFRDKPGCLFKLTQTTLEARKVDAAIEIRNTGAVPAVAVYCDAPDASNSLRYDDGYFWLEPGEVRNVAVSIEPDIEGVPHTPKAIQVSAWNANAVGVNW
ncbi:MAG: hypothetical protein HZB26_04245 [Candidatus Hydrogenedentes bacterium]|nr:hypothetical protein [Candidatus Hydrogenedentota bacterium]